MVDNKKPHGDDNRRKILPQKPETKEDMHHNHVGGIYIETCKIKYNHDPVLEITCGRGSCTSIP